MAQVSDKLNVQPPTRAISLSSVLPLIFGVLLLVGTFLPFAVPAVDPLPLNMNFIRALAVIAVGLSLWTIYDVRSRFVTSLLSVVIGLVAIITLFNFVAEISRSLEPVIHVGTGFWVSVVGAAGLILQIFFPRPKLVGVNVYGESGLRDFMSRMGILGELLGFLWKRKLYWLIPMVLTLMIFIVLIVAGSNSAIAPFIYTLF